MATLKLKRKPGGTREPQRPPVRGAAAPRRQRTLAEAQAERAARDAVPRAARDTAPRAVRDTRDAAPRSAPPPSRSQPQPPARERVRPPEPPPRRAAPPNRPRPQPAPVGLAPPHREGERLSKRMTALGIASRREADEWIEAGWVRVDGRLAVLGQRVGPDVRIDIDPAAQREQLKRRTVLLHKPLGYVSGQAEDGHAPAVVLVKPETRWAGDASGIAFHPGHLRSLVPAGRLDLDSTGLLVLTQDGRIARELIGEDSRIEKEYLVRVEPMREGSVPDDALDRLGHGLDLDGEALKPAKVSWQSEGQLRFVLREGRKRQIRRMCELVGLRVVSLKRVRIGSVSLGPLPAGQWRYLRHDERFA